MLPKEKDGKWGYISFETEKVVVPYQYSSAEAFTDLGIAKVKIGDKWGLLGSDGKELIPVIYDWIYLEEYSKHKIIRFKLDGKWGLFDVDLKTILPAKYEMILHFQGHYLNEINDPYKKNNRKLLNYFKAKKAGKWGVIDETDKTILSFKYDDIAYILKPYLFYTLVKQPNLRLSGPQTAMCGTRMPAPVSKNFFVVKKGNKGKIITRDEKVIYTIKNYQTEWKYNQSGVVFYTNKNGKLKHNIFIIKKNNRLGIVSAKGKLLLPFEYEDVSYQYENIFHIKKAGKYGIVNSFGDILQPPVYDKIYGHQVTLDNKHGILKPDHTSLLFPIAFDNIKKHEKYNGGFYSPHKLIHVQKGHKEGLLNEKGDEILPLGNQKIVLNKNCLFIKKDTLWGMMDYDLSILLNIEYDSILTNKSVKQMFVVKKKSKFGLWNISKKDWEIPLEYDSIKIRSKYEVLVQKNHKWGLFQFTSGEMTAVKYDEIKRSKGRVGDQWEILAPHKNQQKQIAQAEKRKQQGIQERSGKYGVIGKDDQWLLTPQHEKIWDNGSFYTIIQNDKKGIMASDGRYIIKPEYEEVPYEIGDMFLRTKKNGKWGIINTKNEIIIPFSYDRIEKLKDGILKVLNGDYWTMINMEGNPICESSFSSISKIRSYENKFKPALFHVTKHYLAGIIDEEGNEIIPCRFQGINRIIPTKHHGLTPELFPVKNREKWGYALKGGEVVIPFQFDDAFYFNGNMAIVKNEENYFLINKKGAIINDEGYVKVVSINPETDLAIVVNKQGKYGAINSAGKEIIPLIYGRLEEPSARIGRRRYEFSLNGKKGVIDYKGMVIIPEYSGAGTDRLKLGIIAGKKSTLRGFSGKFLLKKQYDNVRNYYKNFYIVEKNGKAGIIDILTEKEILPLDYTNIPLNRYNKCATDYFVVQMGEKVGLVDQFNTLILPFEYESIHYTKSNILILQKDDKYALADLSGNLITGFEYELISATRYPPFHVQKNGKCGYIDTAGKIIYPIELDQANGFSTFYKNKYVPLNDLSCDPSIIPDSIRMQAPVKIAGKSFWLSMDGQLTENTSAIRKKTKDRKPTKTKVTQNIFNTYDPVERTRFLVNEYGEKIIPDNLAAVHKYSDGFIPFEVKRRKYGFYFPSTKKVVYYEAVQTYPSDGASIKWIRNNGKYGFINNEGKEVTPQDFEIYGKYKEGMISVLKDGKMGFLDESGAMKIPMIYEDDGNYRPYFENGVAYAYLNGKYGFINPEGETVAPFEYDAIAYFKDGEAIAYRNGKWEKLKL